MQYTVASQNNVTLNPATNQFTGATDPGRRVQVSFGKRPYGSVSTSCSYGYSCAYTTANASGNFTLTAGIDVARGDYADLSIFDAEGNYQYNPPYVVPAIVANPDGDEIQGYWSTASANLTVTLKNSSDVVRDTDTTYAGGDYSFYYYPSSGVISPTDKIDVTDGVTTETMTVQNLTARLNSSTGHLTGSAYNGHLVTQLWDFRHDQSFYWNSYCSETNVSGSAYNLTFNGAQIGGQDYAFVYSAGSDGHYTERSAYAFTVNAEKDTNFLAGYAETGGTPVSITLSTGATPRAIYNTTAANDGYYYALLSSGNPVTISQGDTLRVQTGDGYNVSLNIPALTTHKDTVGNRIYGVSPANEPVEVVAKRWVDGNQAWYSFSNPANADNSGNYSVAFNGQYWRSGPCSLAQINQCVQPEADYYNAAGHLIYVDGPFPSPVAADIYESDNISSTASMYSGIQHHSFDVYTDTDWIKFTVPVTDVVNGTVYRIGTFNLGWDMATSLTLYDTDGTTELNSWSNSESYLNPYNWVPLAAGTYYLQITPPTYGDPYYYTGGCDSIYDLMILPVRAQVYLPLIRR